MKDDTGTFNYMAPEQFNDVFNFEVDIWAAGCCMYMMCTGHIPFPGLDKKVVKIKIIDESYPKHYKSY